MIRVLAITAVFFVGPAFAPARADIVMPIFQQTLDVQQASADRA